jgi:hypothetical protein
VNLSNTLVVFDTCVLLKPRLSDVLMDLRTERLFSAHWTENIDAEFLRNMQEIHGVSETAAQGRLSAMKRRCPEWQIPMSSVDFTNVPGKVDEKDRHVAAAALALRHSADEATEDDEPALVYDVLLVTDNVVDLAKGPMRKLGVRVITSGAFFDEVYAAEPAAAERAIQQAVKDLKNPPYTVAELLFALKAGGAKELVTELSTRWTVIPTKHDHPAKGKGREPTKG